MLHSSPAMPSKRKRGEDADTAGDTSEGSSLASSEQNDKAGVIFILENASLQKGLVKKRWKILNSGEDADFLQKQKMNPEHYIPLVVFHALRDILDSPLNKAGLVRAIYVKVDRGVLFEIKPHVRIPRTCKRFCGIILDLLQKSCVRNSNGEILLRVLKEPVTRHLPVNSRIIGLSYHSKKMVDLVDYVFAVSNDLQLVFVVGANLHGSIRKEYIDDLISVSHYPLEAETCIGLIFEALEKKWKII